MEANPNISVEIPTALPGFEDDDLREKLLLETTVEGRDSEDDNEEIDLEKEIAKPKKHRWQVLRMFAGFAVFVCLLAVAISWFFGMGWFAEKKPEPVSRGGQKDAQTAPVTEDEKLKMALSMVAAPAPVTVGNPEGLPISDDSPEDTEAKGFKADMADVSAVSSVNTDTKISTGDRQSYSLPSTVEGLTDKSGPSDKVAVRNETPSAAKQKAADSDSARGRSLFFGLPRKTAQENEAPQPTRTEVSRTTFAEPSRPSQIPFGTLLPVRLVGSIYTLRNSAGFVRMELTRPIEGKGYSYPAGTMIVGNVRGGESARAFVTIAGLIDPVSGELVRFSGELLGRDGGSGIEGRRRNLTSQWSRFFRGLKDTAASVLGSVGAIRSGSTVILAEPIRRGTESMSEDLSGALLKNEREDTFLQVPAGSNGYVLVTGLPENSPAAVNRPDPEAGKE
jgi:cytoskeletal protein RodZ